MVSRAAAQSQRRDDIVAAARRLLREPGDAAFSMRNLAVAANVSIATPYNLFGSKQGVLVALLDADLAEYEAALGALATDGIDRLFEAVELMLRLVAREPDFYRNVLGAVCRDGHPELLHLVGVPRYRLWKRLLQRATETGHLDSAVDPDAFAVALGQLLFANVQEWAIGRLGLEELGARVRYGLALSLRAIATETARPALDARMRGAETTLKALWRTALLERLRQGPLDEETRQLLADQLRPAPLSVELEEIR